MIFINKQYKYVIVVNIVIVVDIVINMVKHYRKHLSEPWFILISVGCKTVEGRLNQGDWTSMEEGDQIDWYNEDYGIKRELRTVILSKRIYPSLTYYLHTEGLHKTLPTIKDVQDGLKIYYSYYKSTDEEKYGIVAFELKVVSND